MQNKYCKDTLKRWGSTLKTAMDTMNYSNDSLLGELYNKFGICLSDDTLKSYKSGKRNMPSTTAFAIAIILEIDLENFLKKIHTGD